MKRTITIVVEGPNKDEMQDAFKESVYRINAGNIEGAGMTQVSSFRFEIKEEQE